MEIFLKGMAMKLSEAIREGAKLRPQCKGAFYSTNDQGVVSSCALGAAYEAVTGELPHAPLIDWHDVPNFPELPSTIETRIIAMNDSGRTREEIADILASEGYS